MIVNQINIILFILISFIWLFVLYNIIIKKYNYLSVSIKDTNSITTINGLRGYLAIGVFFHHYIISYYWYLSGSWIRPPQDFINNLGQAFVILFFYISGYLFFRKIINMSSLNIWTFFIKRFFRLAPLYYFVLLIMFFILFYQQNFMLYEPLNELVKHIAKWFLFLQADVNKFLGITHITAGVTWTLMYEVSFYIVIPILFILIKKIQAIFMLLLVYVIYLAIYPQTIDLKYFSLNSLFFVLFFMGYIFVHLEKRLKKYYFNNNLISTIVVSLLSFELFYFKSSYGVGQFMILAIVFALIILGNSIFGILNSNFSRILGEISYSIYLVHGLVLYILFNIFTHGMLEIYYMPFILSMIVLISLLTYKYIELPMIIYGKNLSKKLEAGAIA